jgi:tetratricopeptide (TPR) repeat protein
MERHRVFWKRAQTSLARMKRGPPPVRRLADAVARHLSSVANNFGVYLENNERASDAVEAYRTAILLAPKNISACLNLREALFAAGEDNEAKRADADVERLALEQKMSLKSLVDTYGHVRTKDALDHLRDLWSRTSRTATPASPLWKEAMEAAARGESQVAREKLEKLLRNEPDYDPAWVLLATLAKESGDRATLQRVVQRMRSDDKEWPQVLMMVGEDAMKHRDFDAARKHFERVAQLWPDNIEALELLVKMDLAKRRAGAVPLHLDELLTLDPKNPIGNFALGSILVDSKDYDLAEIAYRTAIERQRYPPALNNLAWLLHIRGRLDAALAFAREATQADPTSCNAWDTLGVVHMERGSLEEAEAALKMAQTVNPDALDVLVHLAEVQSRMGKTAEARAIADRLLAGTQPLSDEFRQQLRALAK